MTIIHFPGGPKGRGDAGQIERASALKGRLVDFVTRGPMRERHARAMREAGLDEPEFPEYVDFTDWFIFEWEDEDGALVLDEFLAATPDLDDEAARLVEAWHEAVDDTFQVVAVAEDGVELRDGDGETYFAVPTNMKAAELGWRPRTLVQTRLLPVGDVYLLSGIQSFFDGATLGDLPEGIDLAAIAGMIGAGGAGEPEDEDLVIPDVRELAAESRPEGSLAADGYDYLAETTASLKPETADAHAFAVSLVAYYASERGLERAGELDADALLDFLAVWYPGVAKDRTLGATRRLLGSVGKFAAWVGRRRGTAVGAEFKRRVLPALAEDLPRTLKAADEFDRVGPMFGLTNIILAIAGDSAATDTRHGRFAVVAVDREEVTLRERPDEAGAASPLLTVEFPPSAAALLRPGDVVECAILEAGDRPTVESVDCIYCPAAGV